MDFVAIDFETANRYRDSACSVAAVEVRGGRAAGEYYSLIRPPKLFFEPFHISIHGITPDDVRDKPTFAELWPELKKWLEGRTVVAHNAPFDMGVLRQLLRENGLVPPSFSYCDTVTIARKTWPNLVNHKLGTVGEFLHFDFRHHHALDDAKACAAIPLYAARQWQASDMPALAAKLQMNLRPFRV